MRHQRRQSVPIIVLALALFLFVACHASPAMTPPLTETPWPLPAKSAVAVTVVSELLPTPTLTLSPTHTPTLTPPPTAAPTPSPTFTLSPTPSPSPTLTRTPTPSPSPTSTPTPTTGSYVYGRSAGGRELIVWQFGHGPVALAFVGGVHGGLEWNTTELVGALRDCLLADPGLLPGGVRLLLVPLANPDGAAAGVGLAGRVNAHGVDLARDWRAAVQWGEQAFAPDFAVLPEPENVALHDLLVGEGVGSAVFYHSFDALCLHGGIFHGPGRRSASLAVALSEATGYPISPPGADYPIGRRPVEWLAAQGLAAVDVHLPDRFQLDWEANLAGLVALIQWAIAPGAASPSPTPAVAPPPPWTLPSPLYGDLEAGYPLTVEAGRFTLHYQPGAPADGDTDYLVAATERALAHVNETLGVNPAWHFDLYVAGTPFASPGETARGYSMSAARKVFCRYDGSGPLVEFESGLAHELTHLTALNEFDPAASAMISEGLAVYVQWPVLEAAGWLALDAFCAGMQSAGAMPSITYLLDARYWGYLDQDNYMASGCFVAFLAEHWGIEKITQLYHPADWESVTGLTLAELDALWAEAMTTLASEVTVDGAALVGMEAEMGRAYAYLAAHLGKVRGQPAGWALDGLRVTWRMGRFDKARAYADEFRALTVGP